MQTMMKKLRKILTFENGELYTVTSGRRILLARCEPMIEIFEQSSNIPAIGAGGYKVKKYHMAIILCDDLDTTRNVDEDFLRAVTGFELYADIQRQDGVFENIVFDNLTPTEIDLDGEWKFEINGQPELVKKLMAI